MQLEPCTTGATSWFGLRSPHGGCRVPVARARAPEGHRTRVASSPPANKIARGTTTLEARLALLLALPSSLCNTVCLLVSHGARLRDCWSCDRVHRHLPHALVPRGRHYPPNRVTVVCLFVLPPLGPHTRVGAQHVATLAGAGHDLAHAAQGAPIRWTPRPLR